MNTTTGPQPSGAGRGCLRWTAIILGGLAALVVILIVFVLIAGARAKAELKAKYPPPGQMVDVGGYKLHVHCEGEGSPTVIMEAGSAGFSLDWVYVQPEVAKFTRACAYDRAGYGWSDRSPKPLTAEVVVEGLHTLLVNGDIQGPYVLVGHSLGGLYVRLYTYQYPDEVVGMVLVDSVHDEELLREPEAYRQADEQRIAQATQQIGVLKFVNAVGLFALGPENLPADPDLPPSTDEVRRALLASDARYFDTLLTIGAALEESYAQVRAAQITSLGDIPLVVLAHGVPEDPDPSIGLTAEVVQQYEQVWGELQSELAQLSPNGKLVVAERSGHVIHLHQPDLVIDAIRQVVEAARR